MIKRLILAITAIMLIVLGSAILVSGQEIESEEHIIVITDETNQINVIESLTLMGGTDGFYETFSFWIQTGYSDLEILIGNSEPNTINSLGNNVYECNVSGLNISMNQSIPVNLEYNLPADTPNFQKKVTHDTDSITITKDEEDALKANDVSKDTSFTLSLLEKEAKTVAVSTDTSLYQYLIIILIIIIIVVLIIGRRTSKTTTPSNKTESKTASEELLSTKKAVLMEVLKEIEKKHRAKQISDDTYHKLKEKYKQEAVEAMKQLEDMKSKVK